MAVTRKPGDLPSDVFASPGGVLRRKFSITAGGFSPLLRAPIVSTPAGTRLTDE